MKKYNTLKDASQELKAARAQLKEFRHGVALLKKKGLLDKKYDARSVKPSKYLKSVIKKFKNVVVGHATTVKVSKEKSQYYKGQGYSIKNNRVIVPQKENEKVYGSNGDFRIKTTGSNGSITRVDLGLPPGDVLEWIESLRKKKIRLKPGESFSFQFYGNSRYSTFSDLDLLADKLLQYETVHEVDAAGDPNKANELITNIVIFKVHKDSAMPENIPDPERTAYRKRRRAESYDKWISYMEPERYDRFLKQNAEYQKERRANRTPEQLEKEKEAARLRAKKSYYRRSGKK